MERSVYSLVLMDEVVSAIDEMAHQMDTSRSNLINQMLAEKVMLTTPEMRMKDIFETMISIMEEYTKFQVQSRSSDKALSIKSSLDYKYNPTIRYYVELYRDKQRSVGELKITSRTQSKELETYLNEFFSLFTKLEQSYIAKYFPSRPVPKITNDSKGRFSRQLIIIDKDIEITTDIIGMAIGDYLQLIDECLDIYLTHIGDLNLAVIEIERKYVSFLNNKPILL